MRASAFYALLCLPVVVWAAIVLPNFFDCPEISLTLVQTAVLISPLTGGDLCPRVLVPKLPVDTEGYGLAPGALHEMASCPV